jgi:hypothetical protein
LQWHLFFLEMNKCHHSRFVMSHLSSAGNTLYYDDRWMKIVSLPILVIEFTMYRYESHWSQLGMYCLYPVSCRNFYKNYQQSFQNNSCCKVAQNCVKYIAKNVASICAVSCVLKYVFKIFYAIFFIQFWPLYNILETWHFNLNGGCKEWDFILFSTWCLYTIIFPQGVLKLQYLRLAIIKAEIYCTKWWLTIKI